jgi:hypothetical protein
MVRRAGRHPRPVCSIVTRSRGGGVAEGVCSGIFENFEQMFCGCAALVFDEDAAQFQRACAGPSCEISGARLAQMHAHWFSMRPATDTATRLSIILQLEAAFNTLVERVASAGRLNDVVDTNRLEWTQLELGTISFPTEAAAREAVLCVKEDGLTLYEVAALCHRAVGRTAILLEEISSQHRELLLAAEPGHLLGPLFVDGRFDVTTLISRTAPALTDQRVAARARQALIDLALERAARLHVTRRARS